MRQYTFFSKVKESGKDEGRQKTTEEVRMRRKEGRRERGKRERGGKEGPIGGRGAFLPALKRICLPEPFSGAPKQLC